jgi:DNA helicase-2/ATP-dependent DNA helicase PcrA
LLPHHRVVEESGDVDEERRLFYVAMTRAREELFLTRARARRTFRGQVPNRPSRFIGDLPDDHVAMDDRGDGGGSLTKEETMDRFAALRERLSGKKEGG